MRKFIVILVISSAFVLCSCAGNTDDTQKASTTGELTVLNVTEQPETAISPAGADAESFTPLNMSKNEIYSLYAAAADKVKFYSAGFTRSFVSKTGEIETVGGSAALGSCIASLAAENGISPRLFSSEISVEHGDAITVNSVFPLCGEEKGCREDGFKCVSKASCGETAEYISLTIEFSESAGSVDSGKLASVLALNIQPSAGEEISEMLGDDAETELFYEYSGGILNCIIEKSTSRMLYLRQSVCTENYINVTADMFVFAACQTQLLCTRIDEITFFDFGWN